MDVYLCTYWHNIWSGRFFSREKCPIPENGHLRGWMPDVFETLLCRLHHDAGKQAGRIPYRIFRNGGKFFVFLSANYGQMDTLVDDGTAAFRKTRLEALFVPCVLLAIYVLFFQQARDMESRISVGFMALFLLLALFVLEKRERLVVGYILAGATVCILLSKANTVLYRALGQD